MIEGEKMNHYKMEELLPIVAKLTEKYTSKESSSVTYETARTLMNAVLYCIKEEASAEVVSENTGTSLKTEISDAKSAYEEGYRMVVQKTVRAKELFERINKNFRAYGNRSYYDTVIKGMPAFFLNYDARFNPQDHILTLDYPTIMQLDGLCGVDAIERYLYFVSFEQLFMGAFPEEVIVDVLTRYHRGYKGLFINICSIVLRSVIGCMIAGEKITSLKVEESDFGIIRKFVQESSREELEGKIRKIVQGVVQFGYEDNRGLYEYLAADVPNFTFELLNAVEHEHLEAIFPF